ncbi:MAG: alpha/beta fold hydrolase [Planctomycetota bacterium]|nr:alpha/beta fold hydrolase [Planctomycetota bacterium]
MNAIPPFAPPAFLGNTHFQTFTAYWPRSDSSLDWRESKLRTFDVDEETCVTADCRFQQEPRDAPTMIFVHGLSSHGRSPYIVGPSAKAYHAGFNSVRINIRNCGETEALTPTLFHAGLTADIRAVIEELADVDGLKEFFLVGFSLGGTMVVRLGQELEEANFSGLSGIVAVSPALDLAACSEQLDGDREGHFYRNRILADLRRLLVLKARAGREGRCALRAPIFEQMLAEGDGCLREFRTMREWNDAVTAPAFGFDDADDYYAKANALSAASSLVTPTLILSSHDDALVPSASLERKEIRENAAIHLFLTERGGHCGFFAGKPCDGDRDRFWVEHRIIAFAAGLAADRPSPLLAH